MITDRQENLMDIIIKEYVGTAKPVGSALIADKGHLHLSSATIRNEMNDLEQAGYLSQLHTSGGRVPTDKAYRFFVNKLIGGEELEPAVGERNKIRSVISSSDDPQELNKNVARVLSGMSDNIVITKVINNSDFYKIGLAGLFEFPEFKEMHRVFEVANLFDRFESVFNKIEEHFFGRLEDELEILIGNENPLDYIQGETMILAKYSLPQNMRGSLTMIGPTRMDYERNIGLIKYLTNQLNELYE